MQGVTIPILNSLTQTSIFNTSASEDLPECLKEFEKVFSEELSTSLPPRRSLDMKIELVPGKEPPHGKIIPLSSAQSLVLKAYLEEQVKLGFMSPSKSSCSSPIFFIKKKDGGLRPCVDYRKLNEITVKNR